MYVLAGRAGGFVGGAARGPTGGVGGSAGFVGEGGPALRFAFAVAAPRFAASSIFALYAGSFQRAAIAATRFALFTRVFFVRAIS